MALCENPKYLQLPQDLPVLNQEQLDMLACVSDDPNSNMLADLLALFTRENEPRFADIERSCTQKDLDQLRKHSHFIAGSTANLGMQRVSLLCKQVEIAILNGEFKMFEEFPKILQQEYQAGVVALKQAQ